MGESKKLVHEHDIRMYDLAAALVSELHDGEVSVEDEVLEDVLDNVESIMVQNGLTVCRPWAEDSNTQCFETLYRCEHRHYPKEGA